MERCDFASITTIIRNNLLEGSFDNQLDFVESLFAGFLEKEERYFDIGQVNRWLNGLAKLSPDAVRYYQESREHQKELAVTLEDAVLPCLSDSAETSQEIYELLIQDASVSERKKQELCHHYPCKTGTEEAAFIADVLIFGMSRPFVARDIRKPNLLPSGSLSPVLADYVFDDGVPKPCRHFCGREKELAALHEVLIQNSKVFLHGIPGIGKSELAKAYAKEHKKDYTNILYITYTGDLKRDITTLDFADDLPDDNEDERFRKHNRFLRTLKEDTLLILDNFNTTATGDALLSVVLKYRCRVLFTTRSSLTGQCCVPVEEIGDINVLFQLASKLYKDAEANRDEVEQIIETVHRHTLAVELAARLLETGILEPSEVLNKLREERAAFDASDKINISKDGTSRRATYYEHIHALFALFRLALPQQEIMQSLTLIPLTGIPARLFGKWMGFHDLNDINELTELGFIQSRPGNRIMLHPMMQEVTLAEFPPSITGCHTMLESIRAICQRHGEDAPYYMLMFQTVENTIDLAEKDDTDFYLLLLEDVFQYMEKYRYESGMKRLINELDVLLSDASIGTASDRAVLLDCRASCEKSTERAIKLLKDALALLPEVNAGNALLASNLNANLGALYRTAKKNDLAKNHMETAITILDKYDLIGGHDSLAQIVNYAVLLNDMGDPERGLVGLRKMERVLREQNPNSGDHAVVLEAMGGLSLSQGNVAQATDYLNRAMRIYEAIWADEPQLIEAKYQQMQFIYQKVGIAISRTALKT